MKSMKKDFRGISLTNNILINSSNGIYKVVLLLFLSIVVVLFANISLNAASQENIDSILDLHSGEYAYFFKTPSERGGMFACKYLKSNKFLIFISIENGTCSGMIEDTMVYLDKLKAKISRSNPTDPDDKCMLSIVFNNKGLEISDEECSNYHGAGCGFEGLYLKMPSREYLGRKGFTKYNNFVNKVKSYQENKLNAQSKVYEQWEKDASNNPKIDKKIQGHVSSIKIKGFFIGMSTDEVIDLINSKYSSIFSQIKIEPYAGPIKHGSYTIILPHESGFVFDSSKLLINLFWSEEIVNQLFNVEDLSAEQFAQEFVNSYDIPKMAVHSDNNSVGIASVAQFYWEYVSKDAVRLRIFGPGEGSALGFFFTFKGKDILLERIPSKHDRSFD